MNHPQAYPPPSPAAAATMSQEWTAKARYYVLLLKQARLDAEVMAWNDEMARQTIERAGLGGQP